MSIERRFVTTPGIIELVVPEIWEGMDNKGAVCFQVLRDTQIERFEFWLRKVLHQINSQDKVVVSVDLRGANVSIDEGDSIGQGWDVRHGSTCELNRIGGVINGRYCKSL